MPSSARAEVISPLARQSPPYACACSTLPTPIGQAHLAAKFGEQPRYRRSTQDTVGNHQRQQIHVGAIDRRYTEDKAGLHRPWAIDDRHPGLVRKLHDRWGGWSERATRPLAQPLFNHVDDVLAVDLADDRKDDVLRRVTLDMPGAELLAW